MFDIICVPVGKHVNYWECDNMMVLLCMLFHKAPGFSLTAFLSLNAIVLGHELTTFAPMQCLQHVSVVSIHGALILILIILRLFPLSIVLRAVCHFLFFLGQLFALLLSLSLSSWTAACVLVICVSFFA